MNRTIVGLEETANQWDAKMRKILLEGEKGSITPRDMYSLVRHSGDKEVAAALLERWDEKYIKTGHSLHGYALTPEALDEHIAQLKQRIEKMIRPPAHEQAINWFRSTRLGQLFASNDDNKPIEETPTPTRVRLQITNKQEDLINSALRLANKNNNSPRLNTDVECRGIAFSLRKKAERIVREDPAIEENALAELLQQHREAMSRNI